MLPVSPLQRGPGKSLEEEQVHQGQTAARRTGPSQGRLRRCCRAPVINMWRQHDQQVTNRPTRLDLRPASSLTPQKIRSTDDQKAKAWWVWKREMVMVCDEGRCIWALNYIICFTLYHGVFVILAKWLGCSCWRCLGDLYDLLKILLVERQMLRAALVGCRCFLCKSRRSPNC